MTLCLSTEAERAPERRFSDIVLFPAAPRLFETRPWDHSRQSPQVGPALRSLPEQTSGHSRRWTEALAAALTPRVDRPTWSRGAPRSVLALAVIDSDRASN